MNNYKIILGISIPIVIGIMYIKNKYKKVKVKEKQIELKKFDLCKIRTGDNLFIIGKRCSGKSTLIGKILEYYNRIPIGIVVSPTESLERFYNKMYKKKIECIYSSNILKKFIKNQIEDINSHIIEDKDTFIVLDNCLLEHEYNDENLTNLLVNGYFYKTINIIAAAYPFGFGNCFKITLDYVFIFKHTHILYKKLIYKEYFADIITYDIFLKLTEKYTQNYGCIVIDLQNGGSLYYY